MTRDPATPRGPLRRRRLIAVAVAIPIAVLLVLLALPVLLRVGLEHALESQGAGAARIGDVDFNPFTGRGSISELHVSAAGEEVLHLPRVELDVGWTALLEGDVPLRALRAADATLIIEQPRHAGLIVGGLTLGAARPGPGPGWGVALARLELQRARIVYRTPQAQVELHLESLRLRDLHSRGTRPARLDARGSLAGAPLELHGELAAFAPAPGFHGRVRLDGLDLEALAPLAPSGVTAPAGRLDLDLALDAVRRDAGLALQSRGQAGLEALRAAAGGAEVSATRLRWQGRASLAPAPRGGPPRLTVDGRLAGRGLRLGGGGAHAAAGEVSWRGWLLTGQRAGGGFALSQRAELRLAELELAREDTLLRAAGAGWNGALRLAAADAGGPAVLHARARLHGGGLSLDDPEQTLQARGRSLEWQARVDGSAAPGGEAAVVLQGPLTLGELHLARAGTTLDEARLAWHGRLRLARGEAAHTLQGHGDLRGGTLTLRVEDSATELRHAALRWQGSLDGRRDADGAVQLSQHGTLRVKALHATLPAGRLSGESLDWDGALELALAAGGSRPRLRLEGELAGRPLTLELAAADTRLDGAGLRWQGRLEAGPGDGGGLRVSQQGTLTLDDLDLRRAETRLSEAQLRWDGAVRVQTPAARGQPALALDGHLSGGPLSLDLPARDLRLRYASLEWQGTLANDADPALLRQQGELVLEGVQAQSAGQRADQERLAWRGEASVRLPDSAQGVPELAVEGRLDSAALTVSLPGEGLQLRYGNLAWTGTLGVRPPEPTALDAQGALSLRGLHVADPSKDITLLDLASLEVDGVRMRGTGAASVASAQLEGLRIARPLGEEAPAPASTSLLEVRNMRLGPVAYAAGPGVHAASVVLEGVTALLVRDADGRWRLLDSLLAAAAAEGGEAGEAPAQGGGTSVPPAAGAPPVRVDSVRITGGSRLRFADENVSPPYRAEVELREAEITALDSGAASQPSPITLVAMLGEYSRLALHGDIEPFAPRLTLSLEGEVKNLDIPPLSSYTARQLGYNLTSGQLDADLRLQIDDGEMSGESRLVLNNIDVKPVDPARMKGLTTELSVPLETALSLLRDENNDIRLSLPVRGDITSPEFDLSDAVNQAIGKALKTAAVGLLKVALQPYGALITIAELAGGKGAELRLDPVVFSPGSRDAVAGDAGYLERLAKLMNERPGVRLRLCGKATATDRAALLAEAQEAARPDTQAAAQGGTEDAAQGGAEGAARPPAQPPPAVSDEQLQALAQARAATLKARLVERFGIAPERLFVCHPELDEAADALPRVELLL